ncbi:MAG: YigZ family protein [Cyclobacteriaceae bacterium]
MNEFFVIANQTEGLYKEKGSKFLAYAYPVEDEDAIAEILAALKKKYYDARHHCYAYIIGLKDQAYRANDDGEPNHSAGDPILGQIRSHNLTNTLVVVVRYFGGTKLGVGGLISAYKIAADEALSKAEVKKVSSRTSFKLIFPYTETAQVERILAEHEVVYAEKNFTTECEFLGSIKDEEVAGFVEKFELLLAKVEIL